MHTGVDGRHERRYSLNILNVQNETSAFIEDMGQHMVGWGVARNTGRVYAYLLVQPDPVNLDQISADLALAKSGASVATRQLMGFGLVRCSSSRGGRSLLYEPLISLEAILAARTAGSSDLVGRLHQGAGVAPTKARRESLELLARMLQQLTDALPAVIRRIKEENGTS